jgi:hypothetical protein
VRVYKVTMPGGPVIFSELHDISTCFSGELGAVDVGDVFTVRILEMTDAEYEALPEFEA